MKITEIERVKVVILDRRKDLVLPYYEKASRYYNIRIEPFFVGNGNCKCVNYDYIDIKSNKQHNIIDAYKVLFYQMKNDKVDHFLIMEDDIVFSNDLPDVISEIKLPAKWHNINFGQEFQGYIHNNQVIKELTEMHFLNLTEEFKKKYKWYLYRQFAYNGLYGSVDIGNQYDHILQINEPRLLRCFRTWGLAGTLVHNSAFDAIINAPYDASIDNAIYRTFNDKGDFQGFPLKSVDRCNGIYDNYSYMLMPQVMFCRFLPERQNDPLCCGMHFLWALENNRILDLGEECRGL